MVTTASRGDRIADAGGFSLIEMMIASLITTVVLGSAGMLTAGVQSAYTHELDDAALQEEAQYVLDWIGQTVAPAGSNPYDVSTADCGEPGTLFAPLRLDPDGNGVDDDLRVQADINPPNGLVAGSLDGCDEPGEDVTISFDRPNHIITRRDATDAAPVAMTAGVFTSLQFSYLTADRTITSNPDAVAFVQVELTGQSPSRNPITGQSATYTYQSEIRVRAR